MTDRVQENQRNGYRGNKNCNRYQFQSYGPLSGPLKQSSWYLSISGHSTKQQQESSNMKSTTNNEKEI